MREQQAYDRLMRALPEMQTQIEEGVRPVAEQVVQQEVERLRSQSEQQRSILKDCLAHIDQSILNCRSQMDEYTRRALTLWRSMNASPISEPNRWQSRIIFRRRISGI